MLLQISMQSTQRWLEVVGLQGGDSVTSKLIKRLSSAVSRSSLCMFLQTTANKMGISGSAILRIYKLSSIRAFMAVLSISKSNNHPYSQVHLTIMSPTNHLFLSVKQVAANIK